MQLRQAQWLAQHLMTKHGLVGYRFKFDNAVRRFGFFSGTKKLISLSRNLVLLNDAARVKNTILHEIAHALAPLGSGHNINWWAIARRIGCDGRPRYEASSVVRPAHKWIASCPKCAKTTKYHKNLSAKNVACGACCKGKYNSEFKLTWTLNIETNISPEKVAKNINK